MFILSLFLSVQSMPTLSLLLQTGVKSGFLVNFLHNYFGYRLKLVYKSGSNKFIYKVYL